MNSRDLIERLYVFLKDRQYVTADKPSIVDMCQRYHQPPLTLHNRVAMQLTSGEYNVLSALMRDIRDYLEGDPEDSAEKAAVGDFYATLDDH